MTINMILIHRTNCFVSEKRYWSYHKLVFNYSSLSQAIRKTQLRLRCAYLNKDITPSIYA
jgi:hypothetical protein